MADQENPNYKIMDAEFTEAINVEFQRKLKRGWRGWDLVVKHTIRHKIWLFRYFRKWRKELKEIMAREIRMELDRIACDLGKLVETIEQEKPDYGLIAAVFGMAKEYCEHDTLDKGLLVVLKAEIMECEHVIKNLCIRLRQRLFLSKIKIQDYYKRADDVLKADEMQLTGLFAWRMTIFVNAATEHNENKLMDEITSFCNK
jgi:hypothetical protein